MRGRQKISGFPALLVLAAAALSGCTYMESVLKQPAPEMAASTPAPETTASAALPRVAASAPAAAAAAPPAPAGPMTREKASTDCWMKYEKEGRGMSLDQRLPLVEKCTAEKMKAQAAR